MGSLPTNGYNYLSVSQVVELSQKITHLESYLTNTTYSRGYDMAKTKRHSRFPHDKAIDGTMNKLNQLDWQAFTIIATFMDYSNHESWVSFRTIRKYVSATSGTRILESILKLQELDLIETWKEPRRNKDGSVSGYERRLYRVKN